MSTHMMSKLNMSHSSSSSSLFKSRNFLDERNYREKGGSAMDALEAESQLDESFVDDDDNVFAQRQVIDDDNVFAQRSRAEAAQRGSAANRFFQTGLGNSGTKNIFGDSGKNLFNNSGGLTPATNAPNSTTTVESSNSEQKGFILRG